MSAEAVQIVEAAGIKIPLFVSEGDYNPWETNQINIYAQNVLVKSAPALAQELIARADKRRQELAAGLQHETELSRQQQAEQQRDRAIALSKDPKFRARSGVIERGGGRKKKTH
jgi:hypothetical protein